MNRKIIITLLIISLTAIVFADSKTELQTRQISVKKAMLLSSLFPGAGQYYADKSSFTTYIFPILEIGLWAGYLVYYNKGIDQERDYEKYADNHYSRAFQHQVENDLIGHSNDVVGFYDNHFRLDDTNTQHFYEDIGKYSKYIFGWLDWYDVYATDGSEFASPNWIWGPNPGNENSEIAIGVSEPNNPNSAYYVGDEAIFQQDNGFYSRYLADYIEMRKEAEDLYEIGRFFSYGIMLNHVLSALDANRLARKHNAFLTTNIKFQLAPVLVNNTLSAALMFSKRF